MCERVAISDDNLYPGITHENHSDTSFCTTWKHGAAYQTHVRTVPLFAYVKLDLDTYGKQWNDKLQTWESSIQMLYPREVIASSSFTKVPDEIASSFTSSSSSSTSTNTPESNPDCNVFGVPFAHDNDRHQTFSLNVYQNIGILWSLWRMVCYREPSQSVLDAEWAAHCHTGAPGGINMTAMGGGKTLGALVLSYILTRRNKYSFQPPETMRHIPCIFETAFQSRAFEIHTDAQHVEEQLLRECDRHMTLLLDAHLVLQRALLQRKTHYMAFFDLLHEHSNPSGHACVAAAIKHDVSLEWCAYQELNRHILQLQQQLHRLTIETACRVMPFFAWAIQSRAEGEPNTILLRMCPMTDDCRRQLFDRVKRGTDQPFLVIVDIGLVSQWVNDCNKFMQPSCLRILIVLSPTHHSSCLEWMPHSKCVVRFCSVYDFHPSKLTDIDIVLTNHQCWRSIYSRVDDTQMNAFQQTCLERKRSTGSISCNLARLDDDTKKQCLFFPNYVENNDTHPTPALQHLWAFLNTEWQGKLVEESHNVARNENLSTDFLSLLSAPLHLAQTGTPWCNHDANLLHQLQLLCGMHVRPTFLTDHSRDLFHAFTARHSHLLLFQVAPESFRATVLQTECLPFVLDVNDIVNDTDDACFVADKTKYLRVLHYLYTHAQHVGFATPVATLKTLSASSSSSVTAVSSRSKSKRSKREHANPYHSASHNNAPRTLQLTKSTKNNMKMNRHIKLRHFLICPFTAYGTIFPNYFTRLNASGAFSADVETDGTISHASMIESFHALQQLRSKVPDIETFCRAMERPNAVEGFFGYQFDKYTAVCRFLIREFDQDDLRFQCGWKKFLQTKQQQHQQESSLSIEQRLEWLAEWEQIARTHTAYMPVKALIFSESCANLIMLRHRLDHELLLRDAKRIQSIFTTDDARMKCLRILQSTSLQSAESMRLYLEFRIRALGGLYYTAMLQSNVPVHQSMQMFRLRRELRVCMSTFQAGGVGLNAQWANIVIKFDEPTSFTGDEQAIARAYRQGQIRDVLTVSVERREPYEAMFRVRNIEKHAQSRKMLITSSKIATRAIAKNISDTDALPGSTSVTTTSQSTPLDIVPDTQTGETYFFRQTTWDAQNLFRLRTTPSQPCMQTFLFAYHMHDETMNSNTITYRHRMHINERAYTLMFVFFNTAPAEQRHQSDRFVSDVRSYNTRIEMFLKQKISTSRLESIPLEQWLNVSLIEMFHVQPRDQQMTSSLPPFDMAYVLMQHTPLDQTSSTCDMWMSATRRVHLQVRTDNVQKSVCVIHPERDVVHLTASSIASWELQATQAAWRQIDVDAVFITCPYQQQHEQQHEQHACSSCLPLDDMFQNNHTWWARAKKKWVETAQSLFTQSYNIPSAIRFALDRLNYTWDSDIQAWLADQRRLQQPHQQHPLVAFFFFKNTL